MTASRILAKENAPTTPRWNTFGIPAGPKVIIAGAARVGKTALRKRHSGDGLFPENYVATMGVEIGKVNRTEEADDEVALPVLWDCAGQEMYAGLGDGYYIGARKAIVMFARDDADSFRRAEQFRREIVRVCGPIPILLVGTKVDSLTRAVSNIDITAITRKTYTYGGETYRKWAGYTDYSAKHLFGFARVSQFLREW